MATKQSINFKEQRDIGHVVNASFAFLRISYFKMIGNLLLYSAPFYIIGALISSGLQFVSTSSSREPFYIFMQFEYYISLFFSLLGYITTYTIVTYYIEQYVRTGSAEFNHQEVMANVRRNILKVTLVSLLYWLVIIGGLILFIIPGVYYSVSNALSRSLIPLENKGVMESLKESRRLVDDNWWRTFGLFFIVSVLTSIFTFLFVIPSVVLGIVIKLHYNQGGDIEHYRFMYTISTVIASVGAGLLYPLYVTALAFHTYSLKELKDKSSLLESIENIGTKPIPKAEDEGTY